MGETIQKLLATASGIIQKMLAVLQYLYRPCKALIRNGLVFCAENIGQKDQQLAGPIDQGGFKKLRACAVSVAVGG